MRLKFATRKFRKTSRIAHWWAACGPWVLHHCPRLNGTSVIPSTVLLLAFIRGKKGVNVGWPPVA
jgi:hypothetical protein